MGSALPETVNATTTFEVPMADINLDFKNSRKRIDPEAVTTLAASIENLGLLQPINVVRREAGGYILIAGFTRYEAVKMLGLRSIAATVLAGDEATLIEANLAENLARTDLSLVSSIEAVKRLVTQLSGDTDEVARRLGYTQKQMTDRLALAACSQSVLDALDEGKINLGHAVLLSAFTEAISSRRSTLFLIRLD